MTYLDDLALFPRMREQGRASWSSYVEHAFVARLADGSLPEAAFRHYLGQDYLFLIHFARAYALAATKADTLSEIGVAAAGDERHCRHRNGSACGILRWLGAR